MSKYKNDLILLTIILLFILLLFLMFNLKKTTSLQAFIYYDNELVKKINLHEVEEEEIFFIDGANGKMEIRIKKNAIKVEEENSPLHLCSIQGWSSSPAKPIVCLPNRVYIKLVGNSEVDVVIG